ncbi:MAG: zinc-binding protein [Xanthomonadaceae bacterium]|nr:zinc-binding protein [Rhodospirillaceae bacterium]NIA18126.1 zinc-binding protein [Xanthomonadaceae bacterium]
MFHGDWVCSECGAKITELPFKPNGKGPLYCKDCHAKRRNNYSGNRNNRSDRQMFHGDWVCSECGAKITELPFEPNGDKPLFCRDCHRKRMQNRPRRF